MPTMTTTTISYPAADATTSMDDLRRRIGNADPAAWEEIVRRYGTLVSATVRSFRLQDADALDAVQMTWLRLAENVHQIRFPERLGGWLATTARRECLHILRQAKLGPNLTDVAAETVADSSTGPEQRVVDADTTRMLWQLVEELPPRRAALIRMLFADSPSCYAEVSRVAKTPVGGIGPTRARALRQLQGKLDRHELGPRTR